MNSDKLKELHFQIEQGRYLEVQSLVNEGVDLNGKNSYGETPLLVAARCDQKHLVGLLINLGADISCCDEYKWTVLHHASYKGWLEIVQSLVNKKADLDVKNSKDKTPLIKAAQKSHQDIIELLINSGADINSYDRCRWTLLHYAAYKGSSEIVQYLVNKEVDLNVKTSRGKTPLMKAIEASQRDIVELLLKSGANINCCDNSGWTLLHHVSYTNCTKIVELLLKEGVDIDERTPEYGNTTLHLAVRFDRIEIADLLLKSGANCNLENVAGDSPFNMVINNKMPNVDIIKIFIEKGAYVTFTDCDILMKKPLLKKVILQNLKLCSQAVINEFNNKNLPLLYEKIASEQRLPHIDQMKVGSKSIRAQQVEQAVAHEIHVKGFCNLLKIRPLVLSNLCLKSFLDYVCNIENLRSALNLNQSKPPKSSNGLSE